MAKIQRFARIHHAFKGALGRIRTYGHGSGGCYTDLKNGPKSSAPQSDVAETRTMAFFVPYLVPGFAGKKM